MSFQTQQNDSIAILRRAIVNETIQGGFEVSGLDPDFYSKIKLGISSENSIEHEKLFKQFLNKRLAKIQRMSLFGVSDDMDSRLTPEEKNLLTAMSESCKNFKKLITVMENV